MCDACYFTADTFNFHWNFLEVFEIFPVGRIIQCIPSGALFISKTSISAFWVIFIGNLQRIIRVFTKDSCSISYWRLDVSGPCKRLQHLKEIKFLARNSPQIRTELPIIIHSVISDTQRLPRCPTETLCILRDSIRQWRYCFHRYSNLI